MKYSIFQQALTIAVILLISKIIESFMPIPMPASVIGLVLLFIALCTGIVKLGQVETVGTALTNNIGFLFVICTGFASQLLVTKSLFPSKEKNEETSHVGG
ncbi:MAG: CidA/LrgA family protein [Staphylococcus epidermidis]|nr:CidA/LrgA family protein [Staphylococcus epidermidis]